MSLPEWNNKINKLNSFSSSSHFITSPILNEINENKEKKQFKTNFNLNNSSRFPSSSFSPSPSLSSSSPSSSSLNNLENEIILLEIKLLNENLKNILEVLNEVETYINNEGGIENKVYFFFF